MKSSSIFATFDYYPHPTPVTPPTSQHPKPQYPDKFTLGVKIDGQIWLTFQEGDGQLEYDHIKYYPPSKPQWDGHRQTFTTQPVTEDGSEPTCHSGWKRGYGDGDGDGDSDENGANYHPNAFTISYQSWLPVFTLKNTVLKDSHGKIGSIVANHQFQFDYPVQPDALYTSGFSIVYQNGYPLLALNGKTTFWNSQASSTIWKLYDKPITSNSRSVELVVIKVSY
ncbi:hypothetical protein KGF57_001096 [Candida theae]|uniref:Cell wall mannoprotein PIR1-like C-terminal domain-containing protein n=1 Tax=Candida theae TaxID=1198502 RepID=A0AAD5BHX6_9ASCO|nr:uncharacterized protein KGF57_001096 [Candida theae]KAI5964422.1 hypothetical protein KGF57_001096 [Candida theae]